LNIEFGGVSFSHHFYIILRVGYRKNQTDNGVSKRVQSQSEDENIRMQVVFFQTERGKEPMREWLKSLQTDECFLKRDSRLAWEYGLRGYDATHFAAALLWQETLEMPITLATYDRELWLAANKAGMAVWPEGYIALTQT
jgi:hypothetical protein